MRDKTIIILGAGNHAGVIRCWDELNRAGVQPGFVPGSIFYEDEMSMNKMATACGVILPEKYWGAVEDVISQEKIWRFGHKDKSGNICHIENFYLTHPEGQLIEHVKSYRLV